MRYGGASRRSVLVVGCFVLAVMLSFSPLLWFGYQDSRRVAEIMATNLATTIGAEFGDVLQQAEGDARAYAHLVTPRDLTAPPTRERKAEVERLLADRLAGTAKILNYRVFNAQGEAIFSADPEGSRSTVADRDWFKTLRDDPGREPAISNVVTGPELKGPILVVGVPIRQDGRFLGASSSSINLNYFQREIDALDLGRRGIVTLRGVKDGTVILRRPSLPELIGQKLQYKIAAMVAAGHFRGEADFVSPLDGVHRLYAFNRLPDHPFFVVVGLAKNDFLAAWHRQTLPLALIGLGLVVWLGVTMVRQQRIQAELSGAVERLREREALLEDGEERYRATFEQAAVGIVHSDFSWRFLRCNQKFCDISGRAPEQMEGRICRDFVHPDDVERCAEAGRTLLAGNVPHVSYETRYVRPDGAVVWVRVTSSLQHDRIGRTLHVLSVIEDITSRRQMERRLTDEALRFQVLLKTASDGIHVLDAEGRVREASESFLRLLGREGEDPARLRLKDFALEPAAYGVTERIGGATTGMFETRLRRSDGAPVDVEVNCRAVELEGIRLLYASARDISSRKTAERERRRGETELRVAGARLKLVLDTAAEGIFGIDDEERIIFANGAAAAMLGWPEAAAMHGKPVARVTGHRLRDGHLCAEGECAIRQTLADGRVRRVSDEYFDGPEGGRWPVEYVVSPLVVEGVVTGAVVVFHDVTERRRAEREIDQLLSFRRAILDAAGNAIVATDRDGVITLFNLTAERLLGYGADQVVGRATPVLFHDPGEIAARARVLSRALDHPVEAGFDALVAKAVATGTHDVGEWSYVRRDGTRLAVLVSMGVLTDAEGRPAGFISVAQDISAIKALERDLTRSNAELERFAYIASHDLRQPLRMVSGYLSLIERRLTGRLDDEERAYIGHAVDGARRMDRMILDLLDYSRIGRIEGIDGEVDLGTVCDRALACLRGPIAEAGAEVARTGMPPVVMGCESELDRLFQNLIDNAVKFRHPERPSRVTVAFGETATDWVVLVADNGIGIDDEGRDRLFNIFQRLVPRGRYDGSGIGLAACRKIAEHHGGRIWVESRPGEGSTFFVALPKRELPGRGEAVDDALFSADA